MIQRADPIPPGRYWLNFKNSGMDGGAQSAAWVAWVRTNPETVRVESTQEGDADGFSFVVFTVLSPTSRWPTQPLKNFLGFPSVAGSKVSGPDDVIQSPAPPPPADAPGGVIDQVTGALKVIGYGAIAAYLLGKLLTRKQ